jgi:hypothetical protein
MVAMPVHVHAAGPGARGRTFVARKARLALSAILRVKIGLIGACMQGPPIVDYEVKVLRPQRLSSYLNA